MKEINPCTSIAIPFVAKKLLAQKQERKELIICFPLYLLQKNTAKVNNLFTNAREFGYSGIKSALYFPKEH